MGLLEASAARLIGKIPKFDHVIC